MKIESVVHKDLNKIYKLEKQTFGNDAFSKDMLSKLITQDAFFLKLVLNKKIIGFIIALHDEKDRINIINLLISKQYRRNGYGTILLKRSIDIFKKLDEIDRIVLNVKVTNSIAIDLYRKFNFKIVDEVENYYSQMENAYLMELKLYNFL